MSGYVFLHLHKNPGKHTAFNPPRARVAPVSISTLHDGWHAISYDCASYQELVGVVELMKRDLDRLLKEGERHFSRPPVKVYKDK